MKDYVKPSLKKELLDKIEQFIGDYPEYGYRSLAQFVEDAIRRRADELNVFEITPRFQHFNLGETGVKIKDRKINRTVDVYFLPEGIRCQHCGVDKCVHVNFAMSVPDIRKIVQKKKKEGWKLPDI